MLQYILDIDRSLLLWINSLHTALGDVFMPIYTDKLLWMPLYLFLVYYLFKSYGKRAWWILLVFLLCVGCADFVSSSILKPWVARPRPSQLNELEGVLHIVNGYRSGRYGFVSSHAANTMVVATLFTLLTRERLNSTVLYIWCGLNCYSRIYLGVHYPGDILGGILLGGLIALAGYYCLIKKYPKHHEDLHPINNINRWGIASIWILLVGATLSYSLILTTA